MIDKAEPTAAAALADVRDGATGVESPVSKPISDAHLRPSAAMVLS
jgi:hypothetical protein